MFSKFKYFFLCFLLFLTGAQAEGTTNTVRKAHNFGLGLGWITGYGMSYRHWGEGRYGFQVSLLPYLSLSENERSADLNIGLNGLYALKELTKSTVFSYYGASYNWDMHKYKWGNITAWEGDEAHHLHAGAGCGLEKHFGNIAFNLMSGYAASVQVAGDSWQKEFPNGTRGWGWRTSIGVHPTIALSLHYGF